MPTAKEIKIYAKDNDLSNAEARKILLAQEASAPVVEAVEEEPVNTDQQVRELARREGTIALGLVVEKRGSGKPSKGIPKLNKKSPIFRVDVTLQEIEQLAQSAQAAMPGVMMDDFAYILGDGLKEGAHLENGEQFAAALCGYFVHTEAYQLIKENEGDKDHQGAIIRVISYKDGYVIRPADYIRSYEQVDQSFLTMKIQ